jgi:hypothetical protein
LFRRELSACAFFVCGFCEFLRLGKKPLKPGHENSHKTQNENRKGDTTSGPPRRRTRPASANGALQRQPSANGLGIVTHKIPSPEGGESNHAYKRPQIPNPRGI